MAPKKDFFALTSHRNARVSQLLTKCHVCPAFDANVTPVDQRPAFQEFVGLWDTGATGSVITQKVVDGCGLQPYTVQNVIGAYGGQTVRPAFYVNLGLPNGVTVQNVSVVLGELHGTDILIGMDIITMGDFAITHEQGKTVFSFRIPSMHTIDYAKQATHIRESKEAEIARKQRGQRGPAPGKGRR